MLTILGIVGVGLGILIPICEALNKRGWPRSTFKGALCLIALGILFLWMTLYRG